MAADMEPEAPPTLDAIKGYWQVTAPEIAQSKLFRSFKRPEIICMCVRVYECVRVCTSVFVGDFSPCVAPVE